MFDKRSFLPDKQTLLSGKKVSFIPIGGIGDVTKNMYLYEYGDEVLIVDCGIGFADATTVGVDFLIPDISYLKKSGKKIAGMVLTHGHEDHIGALPFVVGQLPDFPIYASRLTAALVNGKLKERRINKKVQTVNFGSEIKIGNFLATFVRVTHSVIDTANIFIKTPAANFFHASDFKFDFTPVDGRPSDLRTIAKLSQEGITSLFCDSLGAERKGHSASELDISKSFEDEIRVAKGKVFITTYSSNISRMNQAIEVATSYGRKVCFIGRSFLKSRDIGRELSYMKLPPKMEINPREVNRFDPSKVMILVAGSQAQEESGLVRIASDQDRDIRMNKEDVVIFSADPIPGNEISVNSLIDMMSKKGVKVVYSDLTDEFHVSGHGSEGDIKLMIALTNPRFLVPIGGTYRHMVAFREIANSMGYKENETLLLDDGQEVIFSRDSYSFGKKVETATIFVDKVTEEEIEKYIVIDRKKIAEEGVVIVISEVDSNTGQMIGRLDLISKGFIYQDTNKLSGIIESRVRKVLSARKEKVTNWVHIRNLIQEKAEDVLYQEGKEPLIIPVVIEV